MRDAKQRKEVMKELDYIKDIIENVSLCPLAPDHQCEPLEIMEVNYGSCKKCPVNLIIWAFKRGMGYERQRYDENWIKWKDEKPEQGVEVIAFHRKWIDEDFNPKGTRVGFLNGNDEFTSAYWWDEQDCYEAINRERCEENESFYRCHLDNTEPELWRPIPNLPNIL